MTEVVDGFLTLRVVKAPGVVGSFRRRRFTRDGRAFPSQHSYVGYLSSKQPFTYPLCLGNENADGRKHKLTEQPMLHRSRVFDN